ncbi:MAG: porin [Moritella sp.]|uniref:porin n=1 Tax=unclassified Moritella TaxID=2637987 RepID=UPI00015693F3|nr:MULTISPECIES: porin [unclassified Moritella]EDM65561.1 Outer membrane protein [Moritella sp. PE36]MBL1416057.1 porin [Moritella sp.]PHR90127.1 MAG: porin [Moritella sp.]
MKKTILATAILLAGAANAAEVYSDDTTTISLGGSFRGHVVIDNSDDVNFEDAGSRFDIKAAKTLDNGLKAFGQMEIKYKDVSGLDTLYINNAFLGFEHDVYGKLVLGKKLGLNDDLVMNDFSYENGIYNHQNAAAGSDTQDQLEYTKSFGSASVVVGLINQDTYSIGGTYEVAGLTLGVAYNIANDKVGTATPLVDNSAIIVGAQYSLDALTIGVQYQALDVDNVDTSAYGIGAHYALGQAGVYAMYDILDGDAKADEGSEIVIGADYEIAKDVKTYVEFNSSDNDVTGSDDTLWLGARVYF